MEARKYLGVAIKYPHDINGLGRISLVSGLELIAQSIQVLLETPLGADFDNPGRGSRIKEVAWEPNDEILESLLDTYIYEAIEKWERRVTYLDTKFSRDDSRPEILYCKVEYLIKSSNQIDSFIYPFYRQLSA